MLLLQGPTSALVHSRSRNNAIGLQQHYLSCSRLKQQATPSQPALSQRHGSGATPCSDMMSASSVPQRRRNAAQAAASPKGAAAEPSESGTVAVPAPSNMQATVTLVPKKNASTALLRLAATPSEDPIGKFLLKCKLAWNLFFPPQSDAAAAAMPTPNLSPKELGKQRLQMILVADRCGLSPSSLVEMKRNTLAALSDCMELEDLQDAHLRFTMTREGGTTYSMAVPILRAGPYAEDGSVVGQNGGPGRAANAAMAAAAAAGFPYDDDAYDQEGEELPYDSSSITETEDADEQQQWHQHQHGEVDAGSRAAPSAAASVTVGSQQQQDAGAFKEQLKELLVEELVHDVEDLALQGDGISGGGAVAAVLRTDSPKGESEIVVALPPGVVVDGAGGVMSEQELREAAEQELQRLLSKDAGATKHLDE